MTTRQIAYRLKAEGKTELRRDQQEVAQGFKETYAAAEQGAAQATAAADRLEKKYRAMAQAAQDSAQAQRSQFAVNAGYAPGLNRDARGSAAASASVFMQDDADLRRVEALRASIDPLTAAQNKLNHELKEYQTLANAGKITTGELAQLQGQARVRFDETTAAIARNEKGLTRLALASRLNLTRQASDVFVTAAMGMNPAMIAIQQGPQILDALATSGFKASASMIAIGAGLSVAAAGVVLLGAAWLKGEAAAAAYEDAASGIGRTAGLTASQLRDLTVAAAEQGEISRSAAREQAAAYLATGEIGSEVLGGLIAIGRDYASVMGMDAEEATKSLAKAMEDPKTAAHALTAQMGLLDQAQLRDIDNMIEQGNLLGAQRLLLDELTGAVSGHANRASEITDVWNDIGRSISDALDKLSEFLHTSQDERINQLRLLAGAAATPMARRRFESQLWVEERQKGIREMLDAGVASEATANQQAERDRVAREAREKKGASAARSARAAAAREAREAERERKEALQRSRREEDRVSTLDLEVARARQDYSEVQRIEDANAARMRERQLIDDGTAAEAARTKALEEQQRLIDARADQQTREIRDMGQQRDIEIMRLAGEDRFVQSRERALDIAARILAYEKKGLDTATARNLVESEIKDYDEARAQALERSAKAREREWKAVLAQASGDRGAMRDLNRESWIASRAEEIEKNPLNPLNSGEGREQAAAEYGQLMRAQTTGAFRDGIKGMIADLRSGGIRDALANQFDNAADRLLNKLIDGFLDIDFSGGSGKGAGSWISKGVDFLFGRNAEGTDFWTGGPTWVGERGPELLDLPRGSRVIESARSMDMVRRATTGSAQPLVIKAVYAPSHTISGVDTERLEGLLAQDRAEFEGRTIATVNDAIARRQIAS